MKVVARVFVTALAFGVSGAPIVLEHCLMTCHETSEPTSQTPGQTGHPCHHTSDPGATSRLHGDQSPCDHDDGPAGTTGATDAAKSAKSFHDATPCVALASLPEAAVSPLGSPPFGQPPGSVSAASRAVPLRI